MAENENSYKSILKGTSILGSVQVFQILVNLIRGKFVAMFLGPEGMGIASLFNSSANTISRFASMGLNLSFVKEVASRRDEPDKLAQTIRIAKLLAILTAILGALATLLLATPLSIWTFGTPDYAWQYALMAVAIFFMVAGYGECSILQGLHKVKLISITSLAGALSGLLCGVPLYYFFGARGIVPAMIILSVTSYVCYRIGLIKGVPKRKVRLNWKEHMPVAKKMLTTGIILLSSSLINTCCTYLINIFVRVYGDLADVGLFNAANSITMQYVGVVFSAMALDYFPRLTAVAEDMTRMRSVIDRQLELVAIVATPLSLLLVATAPIVIRILLTSQFLPVTPLMRWLGISILLKAIAYPLGYIAFAKDNRRLFFLLEGVVCNILYLGLSLLFYRFFGLMGLGYAAVLENGLCIILYLAVNYRTYGYLPNRAAWREIAVGVATGAVGFTATLLPISATISYLLIGTICLFSSLRAFRQIRHRI
ncbi:MAG: oligosaccharide flippase family protein [Muribaculaceae bacterium]|nr:oligosaccharide flippase family protein [Muribaculaceae bacterium]